MILYYYTSKQFGLKSLFERRLKVAQYADLNDPFELLPFEQKEKHAREQLAMVVSVLSASHGVLCFSESWRTTLLWAHYADKHKGMVLGFEIEDGPLLTSIEYVTKRLPSPIDLSRPLNGIDEAVLVQCLNSKHSGWRYEKERRLRVQLNEMRDGIYYNAFNNGMDLREVVVGARCTLDIVDVAEAVGQTPESDVRIWTARAAHQRFSMCTDTDKPSTVIPGLTASAKKAVALGNALRH